MVGKVCEGHREACIKMVLPEDHLEMEKILEETATIKVGKQLRQCLVTLVLNAIPANPKKLWDNVKVELCREGGRDLGEQNPPGTHGYV